MSPSSSWCSAQWEVCCYWLSSLWRFIELGTVHWNLRGSQSRCAEGQFEDCWQSVSAETSRVLITGGQRIDVGIVEKRVVAVPPGEGLGSDAEVVIRDELWALVVASVHPAVKGAEGYAGKSQHKGQEAPGVGSCPSMVSFGCAGHAPAQDL